MPDGVDPATVRRCRPLLGTFVEIAAPAGCETAIDAAFAAVAHVHARMSFHDEASDLAALRRAPAGEAVAVDRATVAVLRFAAGLHARSGGLFDIAVGARLVAAGFLPRPAGVDLRRMTGTAADIELLDDTHVRCRRPLMIDLGGIAKGYAVDCAADALIARGAASGLINAGGDLRVIGSRPQQVWLREADGGVRSAVTLTDAALASSANLTERRRHRGSMATPHIGRNGRSVLSPDTVTIVAPSCMLADAMTKIALADQSLAAAMLAETGGAIVARPACRAAA